MLTQNYSNFTDKMKTASCKYRINMVTLSFLQFAVNVILNLSNNFFPTDHVLWFFPSNKNVSNKKNTVLGSGGFFYGI